MTFWVVPDSLYDAIQAKLDQAIADRPDAEKDREHLYKQLLAYFNENGVIPEFSIMKKDEP